MEGKMKGRKRTLRKGLSGKILSFTMALAMVANLMGGYCAATELSTKEVKAADAEQPPYRNVMYYGDWSIYSGQKNFTPDKIDGSLITHLNFAFMDADANGDLITTDTWADYENPNVGFSVGTDNKYAGVLGAMVLLRQKYPNMKIGVSVGGWTRSGDFPKIAASETTRKNFANNVAKFVHYYGEFRRADAIHLTRSDTQRTTVLHHYDSVRLHMLDNTPAEIEIGELPFRRPLLRHAHIRRHGTCFEVEVLHQQSSRHTHQLALLRIALLHRNFEQTQILLRREHFEGFGRKRRGHDDLQKNRLHQFGRLTGHRSVQGDDTAENRHLVGLVSLRPGIRRIPPHRSTAGIHMFESHAERLIELPHDRKGCVGILYVIVGHLLAIKLPGIGQRIGHPFAAAVELGLLVRILSVAERLNQIDFS